MSPLETTPPVSSEKVSPKRASELRSGARGHVARSEGAVATEPVLLDAAGLLRKLAGASGRWQRLQDAINQESARRAPRVPAQEQALGHLLNRLPRPGQQSNGQLLLSIYRLLALGAAAPSDVTRLKAPPQSKVQDTEQALQKWLGARQSARLPPEVRMALLDTVAAMTARAVDTASGQPTLATSLPFVGMLKEHVYFSQWWIMFPRYEEQKSRKRPKNSERFILSAILNETGPIQIDTRTVREHEAHTELHTVIHSLAELDAPLRAGLQQHYAQSVKRVVGMSRLGFRVADTLPYAVMTDD